jgi:hypothetical protein
MVSDRSQPPMTFDLSLSESAGSRSLHRLVGHFDDNVTNPINRFWTLLNEAASRR